MLVISVAFSRCKQRPQASFKRRAIRKRGRIWRCQWFEGRRIFNFNLINEVLHKQHYSVGHSAKIFKGKKSWQPCPDCLAGRYVHEFGIIIEEGVGKVEVDLSSSVNFCKILEDDNVYTGPIYPVGGDRQIFLLHSMITVSVFAKELMGHPWKTSAPGVHVMLEKCKKTFPTFLYRKMVYIFGPEYGHLYREDLWGVCGSGQVRTLWGQK